MKAKTLLISIFLLSITGYAQNRDLKTAKINKQLKDFPDKFDLSTPLNAGVTCAYLIANGTENLWAAVSTERFSQFFDSNSPNRNVSEEQKTKYLSDTIQEVIIYKDSIACMIIGNANSGYTYRSFNLEKGKWLNIGEDFGQNIPAIRNKFATVAPSSLSRYHKMNTLKTVSTDTATFLNYIKKEGKEPTTFLLDAFATHKLVIYGEVHRRKISWDLLKNTIKDPQFAKTIGTIFLELPSNQQSEFDRFFATSKLDAEILLNILRSEQIYGWWDKGEYEFLVDLWHLNQTLPKANKIRVVPVDYQPPYHLLNTPEEWKISWETMTDRNDNMANIIKQTIQSESSNRNHLFIVGYMHAYKSEVPTNYPEHTKKEPKFSAGQQLSKHFPKGDIFVIFQHSPVMSNSGRLYGELRQGLFDTVFAQIGNKPVAFNLQNSPFGKEPFDADYELSYDSRTGSFENNFDGYIFFGTLRDEPADYLLYDIFSDKFVDEMKRRAALTNRSVTDWFDIKEVNKESIIEYFKKRNPEGKKRWGRLFE